MKEWKEITHYAGLDWASDHHDIAVVDQQGKIVLQQRFSQTAEGWKALAEQLKPFGTVAVAVETNHGIAVEQMLAQGLIVYPINPKSAERYRGRKSPSGVKNDQLDAWSLADALRLDGHGWKPLAKEDPFIAELRLLTRDEVALIEQRTGLINQLIAALRDYYPAALEAFDDWTLPGAWAFVERFPQALPARDRANAAGNLRTRRPVHRRRRRDGSPQLAGEHADRDAAHVKPTTGSLPRAH